MKYAPLSPWINYPTGNRCQLSWRLHFTKTDGCPVSPVSIHYHEELTFVCLFPPPLQICKLVADLRFNGIEKSAAKTLLRVKVIVNPRLLHSSELHCGRWACCQSSGGTSLFSRCHPRPDSGTWEFIIFCRSSQDSLWYYPGHWNFCPDFARQAIFGIKMFSKFSLV